MEGQCLLFAILAIFGFREISVTFAQSEIVPLAEASRIPETLNICILMERDMTGSVYDYNKMAAAFDLGFSYAKDSILPSWLKIRKIYRNIGRVCSEKTGIISHGLALLDKGIDCHVYLGPGCGAAAEVFYGLADFLDKPIFACPSASLGISAPSSAYPLVVRVSFKYSAVGETLLRFFISQNYTTPVFFQDNSITFYQQLNAVIQITVRTSTNLQLKYNSKFVAFKSKDLTSEAQLQRMLTDASVGSRVFVLLCDGDVVRKFMVMLSEAQAIAASKLGMTLGDYVFIGVELYESDVWGSFSYRRNDSEDEISQEAYRTLLLFSLKIEVGSDVSVFLKQYVRLARANYNYTGQNELKLEDPVIYHSFDSVVLYTVLVSEMAARGLNYHSGLELNKIASRFSFVSPVSGNVNLDEYGDRAFYHLIRSFDAGTGKHENALGFPADSKDIIILGEIDWPGTYNNDLPPNTPRCGFRGENPKCALDHIKLTKNQTAAAVILPLIFTAALIAVLYRALQRYLLKGTDPFWWRILKQDLNMQPGINQKSMKSMNSSVGRASDQETTDLSGTEETNFQETTKTGLFGGAAVSLMPLPEPLHRVPNNLPKEAARIRNLLHANVQRFIGVAVNEEHICEFVVAEICRKGSLRDLMDNPRLDFDWNFKYALMKDIANGMTFLHGTAIVSHGFLNDMNCQMDSRFVLKISGFGLESLRNEEDLAAVSPVSEDRDYEILLWRAPELLRTVMPPSGTQKGDVYSFGILMQQIILRSEPFQMKTSTKDNTEEKTALHHQEIIFDVRRGLVPPLRPPVPMSACPTALHTLMSVCWEETASLRPTFVKIRATLKTISGKAGNNIMDHFISRIETFTNGLEHQIESQTKLLMEERNRLLSIMQDILPPTIAKALENGQLGRPEKFDDVTVYFGNIPGLEDEIPKNSSPFQIISILNQLHGLFSETSQRFSVTKVGSTVNAMHLFASGLVLPNEANNHVEQIASMALYLRKEIGLISTGSAVGKNLKIRAGINSGSCIAAVVGQKIPQYLIFGATVSGARRLEFTGEAGKIQCSVSSKTLLDHFDEFVVIPADQKSKDDQNLQPSFWLIGRT